jgi:hypothetical protein
MSASTQTIEALTGKRGYEYGFVTDIEQESLPPGLDEDVVRFISAKKGEPAWLLAWRLEAFAAWRKMPQPAWAHVHYPAIDFQAISYYAAPKNQPKSLAEVDPKLLETYDVAVDAVFDSVSVATTFKAKLAEAGVIFCSISEAVREHPELVSKYLGTVVPRQDNYFAALNSAVFSDGSSSSSEGRALPDGAVHLLPHQRRPHRAVRAHADRRRGGGYVSATWRAAPHRCVMRTNSTPPWWSWSRSTTPRSSTPPSRTGIRATRTARAASTTFVTKRGLCRGALEDLVDAGRDRLGHHLEVPELRAEGRQLGRRVLLGGGDATIASRPTPARR